MDRITTPRQSAEERAALVKAGLEEQLVRRKAERKNNSSMANRSPLELTLVAGLGGLGELWNGRLRLAVAMKDDGTYEQLHAGLNLLVNVGEARLLLDHIQWLLALEPPPSEDMDSIFGRRIQPRDILVLTPYDGQASYIRQLLEDREIEARVGNQVQVAT